MCTALDIDSVGWNAPVTTTIVNGSFCVANICPAAGNRLINPTGTFSLAQNAPNPFTEETRLEFRTIERGVTRLTVQDILGRTVAVLCEEDLAPGVHTRTFASRGLPVGTYLCILQTPSQRQSVAMLKCR